MTWIAHYGTKDLRLIEVFTRQQDKKANKTRHATTSSRSVEMIFRYYNPNPVSDTRRRY